MHKLTV